MPTYEYKCKTCGGRFEIYQSIKDDAFSSCPEKACVSEDADQRGRGEISRVVTGGSGVVFKGDGFYLTDYARKESKGGEGSAKERSSTTTSSSSESSASDSPPADTTS